MKVRNPFKNLTKFEWGLWIFSVAAITISFFAVQSTNYLSLVTSVLGVTSLIFAARGDAFALVLMIIFSSVYIFVSYTVGYYGEMLIYLCMQIPTSVFSLVCWLKNPSDKGNAEVKIGTVNKKRILLLIPLTICVVTAFYFILKHFNTANLIPSTISVATSFVALYLMSMRLPAYALAFIANDTVLIVLWSLACSESLNNIAMVVCFSIFLINDTYTFICWTKRKRAAKAAEITAVD